LYFLAISVFYIKFRSLRTSDFSDKLLVVKLTISEDLEPQWAVESAQNPPPRGISTNDRAKIGVSQIGSYVDRDLSWGRTSALSRLTGRDSVEKIPAILADATRRVIESLDTVDFGQLSLAVQEVKEAAEAIGVHPENDFRPGMDAARLNVNLGAVTLLDGKIPVHLRGAGSRRLLAMAIHRQAVKEGSIVLVDEIENSLEPYRLRHLIRSLRPSEDNPGQTIFTTHSSVTLVECKAGELCVVCSKDGITSVLPVDASLVSIVRTIPEAFLAHSVIVCEGKTEWGICKAVDRYWQQQNDKPPLASVGVEPIASPRSGGSEAPKYAVALAKLGYQVAYLGDSDVCLSPSQDEMEREGVRVILWDGDVEIERRLCLDLPVEGLVEFVDLAIELELDEGKDQQSVWNRIDSQIRKKGISLREPFPQDMLQLSSLVDISVLGECIGIAADGGKWFKRWDKGEALGNVLTKHLSCMRNTDTYRKLETIRTWCHA